MRLQDSCSAVLTTLAFVSATSATWAFQCETKVTGSDSQWGDQFGIAVAVSGDAVVVGAPDHGDPLTQAGTAYVFERDAGGPGAWGQAAKLQAEAPFSFDHFGLSVALDGDTALVGTPGDDVAPNQLTGAVYVFQRDHGGPSAWGRVARIIAMDPNAGDSLGKAVAISDDTAIAGAPLDNPQGIGDAGAAYIFERNEGGTDTWGQVKKLVASDLDWGDRFGAAVDIDGDVAVVGAFNAEPSGAGAAYIFYRDVNGTPWRQVKKLQPPGVSSNDHFGVTVAVSADVIAVSHPPTCAAYVFVRDAGGSDNWGQVATIEIPLGPCGPDLSASENRIVLGAPGDLEFHGAAYVFERELGGLPEGWGLAARINSPQPEQYSDFGLIVSVAQGTLIVGAPNDDADTGTAFVEDLTAASRYCTSTPNSAGPGAWLGTTGTTNVSNQNLVLVAAGAPPGQFGLFYYGAEAAQVPFGDGFRCVGPGAVGLFRLNPPEQIDASGRAMHALDYGNPPTPSGQITPGSTWYFQFWFRDPAAGGVGFNLTDALALSFCP